MIKQEFPEIIIGLIGAVGTDYARVIELLSVTLSKADYTVKIIIVSKFIDGLKTDEGNKRETERIDDLINGCNNIVKKEAQNNHKRSDPKSDIKYDYLAAKVIKTIVEGRLHENKEKKVCYIIQSIKRVDEINLLRNIYGRNLILISIYTPADVRREYLLRKDKEWIFRENLEDHKKEIDQSDEKIENLFNKDKKEKNSGGQNVVGCFPLGDYFIRYDDKLELESDIERFIKILFGDPFVTPTRDELCMYVANAMACRSSDLSRQIGAVLADDEGSILATGCNDTPKFGGGQYWEGDNPDHRDFKQLVADKKHKTESSSSPTENPYDYAEAEKRKIKQKIIDSIKKFIEKENESKKDLMIILTLT